MTMTYRNYRGTVEYSAEDRVFYGKVMEIDDLIAYEGESEDELERDFRESVDDYIAFCAGSGKTQPSSHESSGLAGYAPRQRG